MSRDHSANFKMETTTQKTPVEPVAAMVVGSDPWLAALSDADLNRHFARAFWDRPLDERTNTYWHDDDTTPEDENHEWKPLPDFVNNWSEVRKVLVNSKIIVPPDFVKRTDRERNRRVMVALLRSANAEIRHPACDAQTSTNLSADGSA